MDAEGRETQFNEQLKLRNKESNTLPLKQEYYQTIEEWKAASKKPTANATNSLSCLF